MTKKQRSRVEVEGSALLDEIDAALDDGAPHPDLDVVSSVLHYAMDLLAPSDRQRVLGYWDGLKDAEDAPAPIQIHSSPATEVIPVFHQNRHTRGIEMDVTP